MVLRLRLSRGSGVNEVLKRANKSASKPRGEQRTASWVLARSGAAPGSRTSLGTGRRIFALAYAPSLPFRQTGTRPGTSFLKQCVGSMLKVCTATQDAKMKQISSLLIEVCTPAGNSSFINHSPLGNVPHECRCI